MSDRTRQITAEATCWCQSSIDDPGQWQVAMLGPSGEVTLSPSTSFTSACAAVNSYRRAFAAAPTDPAEMPFPVDYVALLKQIAVVVRSHHPDDDPFDALVDIHELLGDHGFDLSPLWTNDEVDC